MDSIDPSSLDDRGLEIAEAIVHRFRAAYGDEPWIERAIEALSEVRDYTKPVRTRSHRWSEIPRSLRRAPP